MAVYTIARFEVRPDTRDQAERAMHDYATYVRQSLPDTTWTAFRDPAAPQRYIAMIRSDHPRADEQHRAAAGTKSFETALAPLLVGAVELTGCELVTSSDPQRRHRR